MARHNKKNIILIISLYLNFAFQGVAAIIISQNLDEFSTQWSVSISQVMLVVSIAGLGRILSTSISGYISDKYGRKLTVLIGILSYIIFFSGILLSKNYY